MRNQRLRNAQMPPAIRSGSSIRSALARCRPLPDAAEQVAERNLECAGDADHGGEAGVALAVLEAADLAGMGAGPVGQRAHRERSALALVGEVGAEDAVG